MTQGLTNSVSDTLSQTESQSYTVKCETDLLEDTWGAALYQWVGVSPDGSITVKTALN